MVHVHVQCIYTSCIKYMYICVNIHVHVSNCTIKISDCILCLESTFYDICMALINVFRVGVSRDDAPELFLESREDRVQQAVKTSEDSDELLEDLK